jgi:hypothetical protein
LAHSAQAPPYVMWSPRLREKPAEIRFFGSTRDRRLTHPITVIRGDLKRGYHRHLHDVGGG